MGEHDEMAAYVEAMAEYASAQHPAIEAIRLIRATAKATNHLPEFLFANFGLAPREIVHGLAERVDIERWPDRASLQALFTAWHDAFVKLHGAYAKLSPRDRQIAKAPPGKMSLA